MDESSNNNAPKVIYITNLDPSTSFMDIRFAFACFDGYRSAHVAQILTKTGMSLTGYGTVAFFDSEAAARAKAEMNGYMLHGKPMVVGFEKPPADWAVKLPK